MIVERLAGSRPRSREVAPPPRAGRWIGRRAEIYLAVAAIAVLCLWALLCLRDGALVADERIHRRQIVTFMDGKLEIAGKLTMFPGYHAAIALLASATGAQGLAAIRTLSALVSLPVIAVFALIMRELRPRFAAVATLQFACLPILFPLCFLLYTDAFSLLVVLLSVLLVLRRRRNAAAAIAMLSVLVRQNNIICLLFVLGLAHVEDHGFTLSRQRLVSSLRRHLLFVLGLAGFAIFVVVNRGVAVGDRSSHPLQLSLGNVYLFLFLYFFLLLPSHLAILKSALAALGDRRVMALSLVLYGVFMFTFANDHPYNQVSVSAHEWSEDQQFLGQAPFLRNHLLHLATRSVFTRTLFFIPVWLSCLVLWKTELVQRRFLLVYPLLLLLLAPSWLVEQRYCLVPLALLLAARERRSPALEYATAALGLVVSAYFVYGIDHSRFFL